MDVVSSVEEKARRKDDKHKLRYSASGLNGHMGAAFREPHLCYPVVFDTIHLKQRMTFGLV